MHGSKLYVVACIRKSRIRALIKKMLIQPGFFDEDMCEVKDGSVRYILRRNPIRQRELCSHRTRHKRICFYSNACLSINPLPSKGLGKLRDYSA